MYLDTSKKVYHVDIEREMSDLESEFKFSLLSDHINQFMTKDEAGEYLMNILLELSWIAIIRNMTVVEKFF